MIKNREKMRSGDRILVLEPVDGKAKSTTGIVDNRIFKGENALHAIQHPENSTWSFKYERGILPTPLKQTFTNFNMLYRFADDYFRKRNIKIVKVID